MSLRSKSGSHKAIRVPKNSSLKSLFFYTSAKWPNEKKEWYRAMTSGSKDEIVAFIEAKKNENVLIDNGVNNLDLVKNLINSKDHLAGYNLLHHAVVRGEHDLIQLAINNGIDVNSCSSATENTALHLAVKGHKLDLVEFLIDNGANREQRNVLGERPFDMIRSSNRYLYKCRRDEVCSEIRKLLY